MFRLSNPDGMRMRRKTDRKVAGATARLSFGAQRFSGEDTWISGLRTGDLKWAMREHAEVREAVVVAREDDASFIAAGGLPHLREEKRWEWGECESRAVADALVGAIARIHGTGVVWLESLPLTTTTELDWKALPEPGDKCMPSWGMRCRRAIESRLADLGGGAETGTGRAAMTILFELGGHSLLAMQLISKICGRLNVDLPLAAVFECRQCGLIRRVDRAAKRARYPRYDRWIGVSPASGCRAPSLAQETVVYQPTRALDSVAYNFPKRSRSEGVGYQPRDQASDPDDCAA